MSSSHIDTAASTTNGSTNSDVASEENISDVTDEAREPITKEKLRSVESGSNGATGQLSPQSADDGDKDNDSTGGGGKIGIKCARDSVCMGDDCFAPNPGIVYVSPSLLVDPIALGHVLCKEYLPQVAGTSISWVLQLNRVKFARITYLSEGVPVIEPLVAKYELLKDDESGTGDNTIWCSYDASGALNCSNV